MCIIGIEGFPKPGRDESEYCKVIMKAIQFVTIPEQALFYTGAASRYLGISPNTLRKRSDLGLIPCKQDENGRRVFLLEDLDAYRNSLPPYRHSANPFLRPVKAGRRKGGLS